jgi:hypothetical protein
MIPTKNVSSNEYSLLFGEVELTDAKEDSIIRVKRDNDKEYRIHTGAHGEESRTKNNNESGIVEVTLDSNSSILPLLDQKIANEAIEPLFLKNKKTNQKELISKEAWINGLPCPYKNGILFVFQAC